MKIKRVHYFSGVIFLLFVIAHLVNHLFSLIGFKDHIAVMDALRIFYRHPFIEAMLMAALIIQIVSGVSLVWKKRAKTEDFFERLQVLAGIYLAVFLMIHVSAIWWGRTVLKLDTNIYFGAAGLNTFPHSLFFIPYYSLAILAFFGHLAAVHRQKMKKNILGLTPRDQSHGLLMGAFIIVGLTLYGLTAGFQGVHIPSEYGVLIGK